MKRMKRLGESWEPKWKRNVGKGFKHPEPEFPADLTNKRRHEIRARARREAREIVKEAGLA